MKYLFVSFLFISSSLFGQTGIDIFGKYKIPDVEYSVFSLNLNSAGNRNNSNEPIQNGSIIRNGVLLPVYVDRQFDRSTLILAVAPLFDKIQENETNQNQLTIGSNFNFSYYETKTDYNPGKNRTISNNSSITPFITFFSTNYNDESSNQFTYFGFHSDLVFKFYNYRTESSDPDFQNREYRRFNYNYNDIKLQNYEFELGIGSGKIRDVTSVITALRFEERLKQVNLLGTSLTDDQISALAQHFSLFSYYNSTYDRPGKYFWNDMKKKLEEYGLNLSQSSLHSQFYVYESLNELKFRRNEGSKISGGFILKFQKVAEREYYSSDSYYFPTDKPDNSTRISGSSSEAILPGLKAQAQGSKQLSLYSQVGYGIKLESHINVSEFKSPNNYHQLSGSFNYDHEITDRIVYDFSNNFDYVITNFENSSVDILSNVLENKLTIFIEDQIGLQFDYNFIYRQTLDDVDISPDLYYRDHTFSLGLTYFFNKSLMIN